MSEAQALFLHDGSGSVSLVQIAFVSSVISASVHMLESRFRSKDSIRPDNSLQRNFGD
jgi:hypothetical protein